MAETSALDLFPEVVSRAEELPDDRYTTRTTMHLCQQIAGVGEWDLDAAACEASHWANTWYGIRENGLKQSWFGRVWVNPPFSELLPWVDKAWFEVTRRGGATLVAMLLPANRCDQPFWQEHVEPFRDRGPRLGAVLSTYFLPSRIQFGNPGNPLGINVKNSPPFGCVLLVWRRR